MIRNRGNGSGWMGTSGGTMGGKKPGAVGGSGVVWRSMLSAVGGGVGMKAPGSGGHIGDGGTSGGSGQKLKGGGGHIGSGGTGGGSGQKFI